MRLRLRVVDLVDDVAAYVPNPGLFESIAVDDVVPDNVTYLEGSASPTCACDGLWNRLFVLK